MYAHALRTGVSYGILNTMTRPVTHTRRNVFHSAFLLCVCVSITGFAISGILSQFPKERAYQARVRESAMELARMQTAHAELAARVAYVESEQGRETYVRQAFDVARPGETLIIIPQAASSAEEATTTPDSSGEDSWFQRLFFWR